MAGAAKSQQEFERRFWSLVSKTDTCWLWVGGTVSGYGCIKYSGSGKQVRHLTHRLSWQLRYGQIPDGLFVLHRCDNPPCVNPDHLFLGTRKDNAVDMVSKGRRFVPRGECLSKLSETQVREIIKRAAGDSPPTKRAMARQYGVDHSTIRSLLAGKTWKHVPHPAPERGK